MSLRAALPLLVLVPAVPAVAEEPAPIESVAEIKPGERAELDHRTIQRYGDILGRFDIVVAAAEPDARSADGASHAA